MFKQESCFYKSLSTSVGPSVTWLAFCPTAQSSLYMQIYTLYINILCICLKSEAVRITYCVRPEYRPFVANG